MFYHDGQYLINLNHICLIKLQTNKSRTGQEIGEILFYCKREGVPLHKIQYSSILRAEVEYNRLIDCLDNAEDLIEQTMNE